MRETIGKFQILNVIDKGATATVYLGEDPFTGQHVAIKIAKQAVFSDPVHGDKFRKMFINEASLAGKLRHPHIVTVYDAGLEDDLHYIVMEYVAGYTLERYCSPDNLLPFDNVIEIVFKCSTALDYAARNGVIHRDIKPANLLISEGTDVKITDFGTALMQNSDLTQIHDAVGSPAYMSPEQIQGLDLDQQTDIYSLGVVMYRMLTGRLPFQAKNQSELIHHIISDTAPPLRTLRPDIPKPLIRIVEKCIEKKPRKRYKSWTDLGKDLVQANAQLKMPYENISDTEKFNTLKELDFFRNFSEVQLWEVVNISTWLKVMEEKVLLKEGNIGDSIFVLAHGNARIMKGDVRLGEIETGHCFGEMSYIRGDNQPRTASIISNCDVTVIKIRAASLHEASDQLQSAFNRELLKILADRLEQTSIKAALHLQE